MSFTFDCFSVLSEHKYQQHFAPKQVFSEMLDRPKDTLVQRFMIFLELLTYIKSLEVNEYDLFDGNKLFDLNRFNKDCIIALGYCSNKDITKGKFIALLENLSYEFSNLVNKNSDFSILPEILEGTLPVKDFIDITNTAVKEKDINYVYTGASGEKHIWQGKGYYAFKKDQILDILRGPDMSDETKFLYECYENNITEIKKKFKQEIFVLREVLRFEFDKTSNTKTAIYIKEKAFGKEDKGEDTQNINPGF